MHRNARLNTLVAPLIALAAFLLVACQTAEAQVKPFNVTGAGFVDYVPLMTDVPVFHWAAGKAAHVGNYYGEGMVQLNRFTGPTTAEFESVEPYVFVATNGDRLAFHYGRTDFGAAGPGVVELFPAGGPGQFIAVWLAEFNPVPAECTGKFAKVIDGSFMMLAVTEPFTLGATDPVAYTWKGKGTIEFRR